MSDISALYDHLARLVVYPGPGFERDLVAARTALEAEHEGAARLLAQFIEAAQPRSMAELEEQFTRTFDVNPLVTLEVGWHMFGEQYERGAFLVYMRDQLRRVGLPESTELPDHLTHMLRLIGRVDDEGAGMLTREAVRPGLDKMLSGLADTDNPYRWVLEAIREVCTTRHPGGPRQMQIAAKPRGLGAPDGWPAAGQERRPNA